MNACLSSLLLALGLLAVPLAQAHDPAEHAREAAEAKKGPDCSKLDHSKMDMDDPVAQALMAKCGAAGEHGSHGAPAKTEKPSTSPAKPARPADHGGH